MVSVLTKIYCTSKGYSLGPGAQLNVAKLSKADLGGANLRGADLSAAHLDQANLSNADLSNAQLNAADLTGANLSGANLSGAYLFNADLRRAHLDHADLHDADLRQANLATADLRYSILRGADLSHADLIGADLSGTDLRNADVGLAQWDIDTKWPVGFDPVSSGAVRWYKNANGNYEPSYSHRENVTAAKSDEGPRDPRIIPMRVAAPVEDCPICNSLGWATCPTCNGTKYVILLSGRPLRSASSLDRGAVTCTTCHGAGAVVCPECDGTGHLYRGHEYASGRDRPLRPYHR